MDQLSAPHFFYKLNRDTLYSHPCCRGSGHEVSGYPDPPSLVNYRLGAILSESSVLLELPLQPSEHSRCTPSRGSAPVSRIGFGLTGGGLPRLQRSDAPSSGAGCSGVRAESPTAAGWTAGLRGRSSN